MNLMTSKPRPTLWLYFKDRAVGSRKWDVVPRVGDDVQFNDPDSGLTKWGHVEQVMWNTTTEECEQPDVQIHMR